MAQPRRLFLLRSCSLLPENGQVEGKKEEVLQIPLRRCSRSSTGISQPCPSKPPLARQDGVKRKKSNTRKQEEREDVFIPYLGDPNSLLIKTKKINIMK